LTVFVERLNFNGPVTLSVAGRDAFSGLPADTAASYSFDNAEFSPGTVNKTLPSGVSSTVLRVKVSKALPNPCGVTVSAECVDYAVTIQGSSPGTPDTFTRVRVLQSVIDPSYAEF